MQTRCSIHHPAQWVAGCTCRSGLREKPHQQGWSRPELFFFAPLNLTPWVQNGHIWQWNNLCWSGILRHKFRNIEGIDNECYGVYTPLIAILLGGTTIFWSVGLGGVPLDFQVPNPISSATNPPWLTELLQPQGLDGARCHMLQTFGEPPIHDQIKTMDSVEMVVILMQLCKARCKHGCFSWWIAWVPKFEEIAILLLDHNWVPHSKIDQRDILYHKTWSTTTL